MRGIILEGVTASGKTTLLKYLQRRLVGIRPGSTKVVISEHYTERVLEDIKANGELLHSHAFAHLDGVLEQLEQMQSWKETSKFAENRENAEIFVFLERFLGSHVANLEITCGRVPDEAFFKTARELYQRAGILGFTIAILRLPPERLAASLNDTYARRNDKWRTYLDTIGNKASLIDYHTRWQASLLQFYNEMEGTCPIEIIESPVSSDKTEYETLAQRLLL